MKFKSEFSLDERSMESSRMLSKHTDRVPVICEKAERSKTADIDKNKYLVPLDLTCGQFVFVIRKRLKLPAEQAIHLFVNGKIPATGSLVSALYAENKDEDGFLYMTYSGENTFG